MERALWTIHAKDGEIRAVGDHTRIGIVPMLWAVAEEAWLTALAMTALVAAVVLVQPLAFGPVFGALAAIASFDGGSLVRAELRLRGWEEVGVVEAGSAAGAEELFLTGRVA